MMAETNEKHPTETELTVIKSKKGNIVSNCFPKSTTKKSADVVPEGATIDQKDKQDRKPGNERSDPVGGSSPGEGTSQTTKICVASRNEDYADIVCDKLELTVLKNMDVCRKKIMSDSQLSLRKLLWGWFSSENFDGARLVLLVATADPRMLLISENEESQLGDIYRKACSRKCSVFLLIVGHSESDNLSDTELYHEGSLGEIIKDQPALKELEKKGRLASLGYCYNKNKLDFSEKQLAAIKQWINEN